MKKFFISAIAAVALCSTVSAQDLKNFVVNGNFEDPGFEQAVYEGWTWSPWNEREVLSKLPGWDVNNNSIWNGEVRLVQEEADGDLRPDEDLYIANLYGYDDNGWTKVRLSQILTGLTAGTEYTLSFLIAANIPEGSSWTPDPNYGFVVGTPEQKLNEWDEEIKNEEGEVIDVIHHSDPYWTAGFTILEENIAENDNFEVYTEFDEPYEVKFKATEDKIFLEFYLANTYGQGNQHPGLWMNIDMVTVTDGVTPDDGNGVNSINAEINNAPVEYFNLQGVRVANPENGLFIRRQGKATSKVIL